MPIEIREIIIKTEISATDRQNGTAIKESELIALKKQLFEECKRIIQENGKKHSYKR